MAPLSNLFIERSWRGVCGFVLLFCFGQGYVSGQQPKKGAAKDPAEDAKIANNQQEAIGRLFGIVNELKSDPDRSAAALLQSEVADVIWRFDEPAARSVFRLAFDAVRQAAPNDPSSIDANAKKESAKQSRRWTSAIKTILKRYGLHDRQSAEAWLNEFECEM